MKEEELREATGLSQLTEATGLSQVMEATAEEAMSRAAAPLQDPEEMAVEAMAVGVEAMAVEVDHWCKLMGGGNGGGGNDGGGGGNGGAVQATGLSQVMDATHAAVRCDDGGCNGGAGGGNDGDGGGNDGGLNQPMPMEATGLSQVMEATAAVRCDDGPTRLTIYRATQVSTTVEECCNDSASRSSPEYFDGNLCTPTPPQQLQPDDDGDDEDPGATARLELARLARTLTKARRDEMSSRRRDRR
jgi:hypothetical protein